MSIYVYLCLSMSIYVYLGLSIYLSMSIYVYLSIYLCLSVSIYVYLCLSMSIYVYLCLSMSMSIYVYLCLSMSIYVYLCLSMSIYVYLCLSMSIYVYLCLSMSIYVYLCLSMSIYIYLCLSIYLSTCLSASLKTKLFCETSSGFELDNIKNAAILRDFLQKWKVACSADCLVPMRFAIFPVHLSKLLRLPRKNDARSYEVLHLSRKIISANLKIWCSKMQPLSGNQRPDLLTALMNMSLVLRLPRKMHLCRSSSNVPRLPSFLWNDTKPSRVAHFWQGDNPLRLPRETTSERPKVVRTCGVFNILTSKFASRHNGVHFFDVSTSKSGPNMWCF